MRWLLFLTSSALTAAGCTTAYVQVPVTRPAEVDMSAYQQVAVAEAEGKAGPDLGTLLNQELGLAGFEVLDRRNMARILDEQRMTAADLTDPEASASLGRIIGSAALIAVEGDQSYRESIARREDTCRKREDGETVEVPCTRIERQGNVRVTGHFQVTEVETARLLLAKRESCQRSPSTRATAYRDERTRPDGIDPSTYFEQCYTEIVRTIMRSLAPYTENVTARFRRDRCIFRRSRCLPDLADGIRYARRGDWDRAVAHFEEVVAAAEGSPDVRNRSLERAYWNLGLAYQYKGRFDAAVKMYEKADRLRPRQRYAEEIARARRLEEEQRVLEARQQAGP